MEQNNYWKVFYALAFIAFAAVSCWATQESLHLLMPSWPAIMCWIVTIGFFVIASLGTKMIVDSLNQNVYVEKRGLLLVGGILITLVFWLVCSMPTNTHTFFYRSTINDKVASDITLTKGYLDQLKNNTDINDKINTACTELENQVNSKFGDLESEIKNDANPGFGPKARAILAEFATILQVSKIEPLTYKNTSEQSRLKLVDAYRAKIYTLLEARKENIRQSMLAADQDTYMAAAATDWTNLDFVEKGIKEGNVDLNNADDINEVNNRLAKSYATIKTYSQHIAFKDNDKKLYTAENQVTKVKKLLSVVDVWADFFRGSYAGHGFIFWVLISILVDIAAFIFFDLAFKKDENSI